jgi:hypothetical protein
VAATTTDPPGAALAPIRTSPAQSTAPAAMGVRRALMAPRRWAARARGSLLGVLMGDSFTAPHESAPSAP